MNRHLNQPNERSNCCYSCVLAALLIHLAYDSRLFSNGPSNSILPSLDCSIELITYCLREQLGMFRSAGGPLIIRHQPAQTQSRKK